MHTTRVITLLLLALYCLVSTATLADHLPEAKIARGKADTILSGVDVYHSTIRQAIKKLGPPTSAEVIPEKNDIAGGKRYEWKTEKTNLLLVTWNDKGEDSVPYSAEVWGAAPAGKIGITGRGLKLGAMLTDVRRIYGPRFSKSKRDDGTWQIIVQWQDQTTLYLYFDKTGHVGHMHLMAAIE